MKYNRICILLLVIELFSLANALIKNGSGDNSKALVPPQGNNVNEKIKDLTHGGEEVCAVPLMAEEMILGILNERSIFSTIIDPMQDKLNDNSVCKHVKHNELCLNEKDKTPYPLVCTSDKYEALLEDFIYKGLCHSKIVFSNTLLKSFIDSDKEVNTFDRMVSSFQTVMTCIGSDLKNVYYSSIDIFAALRNVITEVVQAGWSQNIIDVLKKREQLVTGVFCDIRKGPNSKLVSTSLSFEFFTLLKVNSNDLLNEAVAAFSEYYRKFPSLAKSLLEKGGLIDRLVLIHEELTTVRTKNILTKINDNSKTDVIKNDKLLKTVNEYKHHHSNVSSFVQNKGPVLKKNPNPNPKPTEPLYTTSNKVNTVTKQAEVPNFQETTEKKVNNSGQGNNALNTTLMYSENLKLSDVKELIKDLFISTGVIKIENGELTDKIDEDAVKKLTENYFLDLTNSNMLVHMIIKPQVALLLIIQSFIMMTPSPKKDAVTFCKKSLTDGKLVDISHNQEVTDEDKLIQDFASKYNALYENIKMQEINDNEQRLSKIKNASKTLSALQVQGKSNMSLNANDENANNNKTVPVVTLIDDSTGEHVDTIINENVRIETLTPDINNAFKPLNAGSVFYANASCVLLLLFSFLICFI